MRMLERIMTRAALWALCLGFLAALTGNAAAQNTIKIYRGASDSTEILQGETMGSGYMGTSPASSPLPAPAANEASAGGGGGVCAAPITSSTVNLGDGKVLYDISDKKAVADIKQVASEFDHSREFAYETNIDSGCLTQIAIAINIAFNIHLPSALRKDKTGCKVPSQIAYERNHANDIAAAYKALGKNIEGVAADIFTDLNVTSQGEATSALETEVGNRGLLAKFDDTVKILRSTALATAPEVGTFDDCSKAGMAR